MARRRGPKTAAQIAASKRNLVKARQSRSASAKYSNLSPGTYLIGAKAKTRRNLGATGTIAKAVLPQGVTIRKEMPVKPIHAATALAGPSIKFHPYTGKPYDLRKIKGHKTIPLIGRKGADAWLKANTIAPRKRRSR